MGNPLIRNSLARLIFGACAAALLFYVCILVLLLAMPRFGCCPLFVEHAKSTAAPAQVEGRQGFM